MVSAVRDTVACLGCEKACGWLLPPLTLIFTLTRNPESWVCPIVPLNSNKLLLGRRQQPHHLDIFARHNVNYVGRSTDPE